MEFWKANRKFTALLILEFAAIGALFAGRLSGGEFVTLATLLLSIFSAANVSEKSSKVVDRQGFAANQ